MKSLSIILIFILSGCGCIYRGPCIEVRKADYVYDYNVFDKMECCPWCDCPECGNDRQCETSSGPFENTQFDLSKDRYQAIIDEYVIASGDTLEISIFGDEDSLVDNVIVAPDGRIYYFFLEGIYVEGKTIDHVREELSNLLQTYFISPIVTVIPKIVISQSYSILGRVRAPGLYPLQQMVTLRQAIAQAGGILTDRDMLGDFGLSGTFIQPFSERRSQLYSLQDSFVVRQGKKLGIDLQKLILTADDSQDIVLKPGDYIYIAADETRDVFVLGAAASPSVVGYYDGLTLIGALTYAGGWIPGPYGADPRKILVIRGSLHCPRVVQVNICQILCGMARDLYLQPGDIVYVYERDYPFFHELVRIAIISFFETFSNTMGATISEKIFGDPND